MRFSSPGLTSLFSGCLFSARNGLFSGHDPFSSLIYFFSPCSLRSWVFSIHSYSLLVHRFSPFGLLHVPLTAAGYTLGAFFHAAVRPPAGNYKRSGVPRGWARPRTPRLGCGIMLPRVPAPFRHCVPLAALLDDPRYPSIFGHSLPRAWPLGSGTRLAGRRL